MTGAIITKSGNYIFRDDHAHDKFIWAWDIYEIAQGGKITTHKWKKMPKGVVIYFDIDNPPDTVSYLPLLGIGV